MRVGHVELPVTDPDVSARFYVDALGFEVDISGAEVVWLKMGDFDLQLRRGVSHLVPVDQDAVNLVLYSDDVTADLRRLHRAGVSTTERANCFHFQDPDGYWWQLVDPEVDHTGA